MSNFHEVTSSVHFQELLNADLDRVSLINFWAPWAEPCTQMNEVVRELARKYEKLLVLQVEAEEQEDISESFEIENVPTFVVLRVQSFSYRPIFRCLTRLVRHRATLCWGK
jgi:thioredoxin-like negative regulator of GroEL